MQKKAFDGALLGVGMTLVYCIVTIVFCIVNGQKMASTHTETDIFWRDAQLAVAAMLCVAFFVTKETQKLWVLYLIPALLAVTAFLYVFIVGQYPCCMGG